MVVRKLGQATERSSCWIWLKRDKSSWKPTPNTQWLITTADPPPSWECTEQVVKTHDEGWPRLRTSGVTQQHHNALMFSIYPSVVMEEKSICLKTGFMKGLLPKKRDFHVQYLQYVGHSTVGERSMLILRWFGFDSVEYIDTCFSSIKFTPRVHVWCWMICMLVGYTYSSPSGLEGCLCLLYNIYYNYHVS